VYFSILPVPASDLTVGVVLTAGRSSRMGSPKALLTYRGGTFLGHLVEAMRGGGCQSIVVVTGPSEDDDALRVAALAASLGATPVVNPIPDSEQIDSLRAALRTLTDGVDAVIVSPVDSPGGTREIVAALISSVQGGAPIAIPSFRGRRGHPVAFAARLIPELLHGDLPEGARTVIHRYEADLVEIDSADRGVLFDIDTPADYDRLIEDRE
jgi:molybdenum cofactor cytidylyltransferase